MRLNGVSSSPSLLHERRRTGGALADCPRAERARSPGALVGGEADPTSTPPTERERASEVRADFRARFGTVARDPAAFHRLMHDVYGAGYSPVEAERLRVNAAKGDFAWLPKIRFVDPATLRGANGAYDATSRTVFLNRSLDRDVLAATFLEETGHCIDTLVNAHDAPGDEGELLRRTLRGERLSREEKARIRSEDDHARIAVDGRVVDVELWNPLAAAGKLIGAAVTDAMTQAKGDAERKLDSAAHGAVAQLWALAENALRNFLEGVLQVFQGAARLFGGDVKNGLRDMAIGLLKVCVQTPIDAFLLGGGKAVSALQTAFGIERPGRALTTAETAMLRRVYGEAINYDQVVIKEGPAGLFSANDRPFTLGNTIYTKGEVVTDRLLVHEMGHVWQYQNGGSDYLSEAVASQWWGNGYDWQKSVPGTAWAELEPEQQAELLETAMAAGAFDDPPRRFVYGGVDYDDYLRRAMVEVRAGRGAP